MREPKDITISNATLEQVLKDHIHWLNEDCEGWYNMRANLSGANLEGVNLRDANLMDADLRGAYLKGASLWSAYLKDADLFDANLRYADLFDANLMGADLRGANLWGANLEGADLSDANLMGACLWGANLGGANLEGTNLMGANLSDANLRDAKGELIEYRRGKILTEDIIGYKECDHGVIVTLLIPRGAIVFSINGEECRTNRAKVIAIDGADRAYSGFDNMSYYVGDEFTIYNFNCEYNVDYREGIYFFMTREDVEILKVIDNIK